MQEDGAEPELEQEWIEQNGLTYAGLLGVAIVMVQPFLTADQLTTQALVCVVAFSVAIPLLAALVMVNRHETFRRRSTSSVLVATAKPAAMLSSFVGLVAGFWHISVVAGVGMLASGLVALGVHSAGYYRIEADAGGTGR